MATKNTPSWKMTAIVLIWTVVAIWTFLSLWGSDLGGVLAALGFGAVASMLLTGYSSSDVKKL